MRRYATGTVPAGSVVQPLGGPQRFLLLAVQARQADTETKTQLEFIRTCVDTLILPLVRRLGTLGQVLDRRPRLPPVGVEPVHGLLVGPDAARVRDGQIRQRRARREQLVRGQRLSGRS